MCVRKGRGMGVVATKLHPWLAPPLARTSPSSSHCIYPTCMTLIAPNWYGKQPTLPSFSHCISSV